MEDREIVNEFLIESSENLTRLETEIVDLEQRPKDPALLASIFRTIHTIKGTCGFLAFSNLESVTHLAENLLSQLRNGERDLTPRATSLILETMDMIRKELASIEATLKESGETYDDLRARLALECKGELPPAKQVTAAPLKEEPPLPEVAATPTEGDADKQNSPKAASVADSTIRVDVALLDKLMNLVGELVLARNQILQYSSRQDDATLNATSQRLNVITTQLQEGVMKTRMQPIGMVWNKLPRVVRDLASACGKQIQLDMDGAETELDKSIIEAIKDPLTHIVRNCCDHGIETPEQRVKNGKSAQGRLLLRAYHEGGQVNIEIIDDGGGINGARVKQKAVERGLLRQEQADQLSEREAVNLVFLPGLSTAKEITSISGRGVGMDVVKTNIEKIGGVVDLTSRAGHGTTVKIKIPLTLAIIPGLVVSSGGERFIIPQVSLLELLRLEGDSGTRQIERIQGAPVYRRRGSLLPIAYLSQVLGIPPSPIDEDVINIVVLQAENRQFGLVVDAINDTQEIVVKPLGKQLKGLNAYAGATIMGDGKVALILDVLGVGQLSGVLAESRDHGRSEAAKLDATHDDRQAFLLFRAGRFERLAVPLSMVARLEEFPSSRIERAGGKLVVQYRDRIVPLTPRAAGLGEPGSPIDESNDPTQVIVFAEGDRMAGLIVDQIVDIHDETIRVGASSTQARLSGSAVLGGKVTDFLDLPAVLRAADSKWVTDAIKSPADPAPVLVADSSAFSRSLIRNYLELAGYKVVEANNIGEALDRLDRSSMRAVITALGHDAAGHLAQEIRRRPGLTATPIVSLNDHPQTSAAQDPFQACVDRFDREGLLSSLQNLAQAVQHSEVAATH